MATWWLNKALTNFRDAVNTKWPGRDKTSDGTIGDQAHAERVSDHNPDADGSVDAWDMDVDGVDVEALKVVFQAHESAGYWIHNRQIASRNDGWIRRPYTGANPHDRHVHWNTRGAYENSPAPWILDGGYEVWCKHGDKNTEAVWNLQERLRNFDTDTDVLTVDGAYGDKTAARLAAVLGEVGWPVDGKTFNRGEVRHLERAINRLDAAAGGLVAHHHDGGNTGPAVPD